MPGVELKLVPMLRRSMRVLSLLVLSGIVATGDMLALLLSQHLRDVLLARDVVVTQELVQSAAYAHDPPAFFDTDPVAQGNAALEGFFARLLRRG